MLGADASGDPAERTAASNHTVRSVFVIGPDKKINMRILVLGAGFGGLELTTRLSDELGDDVDIVLIDGIDPFGGGCVLPLGRLREPLSSLKRADIFVVTRILSPLRYRAIVEELQRHNPDAPVFMASTVTRRWRLCRPGARVDEMMQGRRAAAFCGLGNPQAFWNTLDILGIDVVFRWTFDDHHLYTPRELHRLMLQAQAAGADVLITTEKDRMNLPPGVETFVAPLDIAWLEIEYKLDREEEFLQLLSQKLNLGVAAAATG